MFARVGLCLLLVAACGPRTIRTGPEAGTPSTVHVWKIDLEDNSNSTMIYARNDGARSVIFSELRLYSCTNLYQNCGTHTPNITIEPGQTVLVARLDPANHNQRPRFGYEFRWRGVPQQVVTTSIGPGGAGMRMMDVEAFLPAVAPVEDDGRCEEPPARDMPPGYRAYAMRFGPRNGIPIRSVSVQMDPSGNPIQFSDSRGDLRVPPPGILAPQPINNPGARTSISLDLLRGMAVMWNVSAVGVAEQVSARGPNLLDAASLGTPRLLIARMVRECATAN